MRLPARLLFVALLAISVSGRLQASVEIDHLEDGTIHFKSLKEGVPAPAPFKSAFSDLRPLGALRRGGDGPVFFLLSGKSCKNPDCVADRSILAVRADNQRTAVFTYPGKILDPKSREVVFESRAFFGHCLPDRGEVYVAYQRERIDRKRGLQPSFYVAEPGPTHLIEKLSETRLPRIEKTLKRVRAKECLEIEGRSRLMLTKPLDLNPRHDSDKDDDDEEDANEDAAETSGTPKAIHGE